MWTLKLCIIGATMLCDTTTYNYYVTEAQCHQAIQMVIAKDLNYIATCEKE